VSEKGQNAYLQIAQGRTPAATRGVARATTARDRGKVGLGRRVGMAEEGGAAASLAALDQRHTAGDSPWHWGEGLQHERIDDVAALSAWLCDSGLDGLEVIDPDATPDYAERAKRLFERDGFVCVKALGAEQNAALHARVEQNLREIFLSGGDGGSVDPNMGAKGAWRYAFGSLSKTGSCLHLPEWAALVGMPAIDEILTTIWDSPNYACYMGGGDFVLPGSEYQPLHSDLGDATKSEKDAATGLLTDVLPPDAPEREGYVYTDMSKGSANVFFDPSHRLTVMQLPTPIINVHFTTVPWTTENGPLRIIPGTHRDDGEMPSLRNEPDWMKKGCCLCPLPAGTAIIRDIRTWHGGTPNISETVRAMPSTNYFAPWYNAAFRKCMPSSVYYNLSPRAQELCRYIVVEDGDEALELGWRELGPMGSATHAITPERMQELRNEPARGSQTGYWPPEGAAGGGPEELQLPVSGSSSAKL
jgi:hypothetical protein